MVYNFEIVFEKGLQWDCRIQPSKGNEIVVGAMMIRQPEDQKSWGLPGVSAEVYPLKLPGDFGEESIPKC